MHCINPNTPQYQEILKEVGNPLTADEIYRQRYLKDGVDELFKSNPKLSSMGTQEEYSSYLDTIFPESKVKDIVYHSSTYSNIQKFKESRRVSGYYFATTPKEALQHAERQLSNLKDASLYSILLNIKNPRVISEIIDYEDLDTEVKFTIGDELFYNGADGIIAEQVEEYNTTYKRPETTWIEKQIVAFEPEQIHILGGEEDIRMFQDYLENKRVEDKRLTPEKMELLAMARETLSEEEVSIVENILNGDENFTDMSNFTCS